MVSHRDSPVNDEMLRDIEAEIDRRHPRKVGGEISFRCPSHDDHDPSASWNPEKQVWTCHACHAGGGAKNLAEAFGFDLEAYRTPAKPTRLLVATYPYRDEQGTVLFEALRYQPKDFLQRQPDGNGGWRWNLKDVRRVLYRLPELLAALKANPSVTIYVVEGEKDADRLASLGLVATTNPQGAGNWRDEFTPFLRGAHIVCIADNDDAGRKHVQKVAVSVQGVATGVKVVELPGLPEKGDVSDWLNAGGTREALEQIVAAAPEFKPESVAEKEPTKATPPTTGGDFHCSDLGNAERFVSLFSDQLRYCRRLGYWFRWTGQRWAEDESGYVFECAKAVPSDILADASTTDDDARRKSLAAWALKTEARQRIEAMVALAETDQAVAILQSQLDADPWLFNCPNGTIDLHTGALRPHSREDLITKLCPVEYDPSARLDLWDRFLRESTGGDDALIAFLRRAVGYSLTGDISEEKLFFVHGPQASGKSTFLESVKAALGDYSATADFEAFLSRRDVGGPRNDIARLAGARAVISIEVDEGKKLAEGLIKTLTGGDTVTARFLYHEAFSFYPTFKLWLAANHAPKVDNDDGAMWRRILRICFDCVVPKEKRDPKVKAQLRDPKVGGPAILAWAVAGCLEWQRGGLGVPPTVEKATEAYRESMDPLRTFLAEFCELKPDVTTVAGDLRKAYESWAKESGEKYIVSGRAWGDKLRAHGCQSDRQKIGGKAVRLWLGIRLLDEPVTDSPPVTDSDGTSGKLAPNSPHEATLPTCPSPSVTDAESVTAKQVGVGDFEEGEE